MHPIIHKSKNLIAKLYVLKVYVLAVLALLALLAFLFFAYSPSSNVFGRVFSHAQTSKKVLALTFDDGPNGSATLAVLDILKKENIKATFFLVGDNVKTYPDVAKAIVDAGNLVGNHTMHHSRALLFNDEGDIREDLLQANQAISDATGQTPVFFRPPFGLHTPWAIDAARKIGFTVITWNNLTSDFNKKMSAQQIEQRILRAVKPGGIITLHDGVRTTHGADRTQMLKALPVIIENLKSKGYQFLTIADLVDGKY